MRRNGKSYAHPLIVLIFQRNGTLQTKVAVSASRPVGNAVLRNKAKRRIREIIRELFPKIAPGWDIILISRQRISKATYTEIRNAVDQLLLRAGLISKFDG